MLAGGDDMPAYGADRLELPAGVERMPASTTGELADAYAGAWASVVPSVEEAFGLVVLESLAAGTPVVGARSGAIPELLSAPEHGLTFEPDDPASLAETLERALELGFEDGAVAARRARAARVRLAGDRGRGRGDLRAAHRVRPTLSNGDFIAGAFALAVLLAGAGFSATVIVTRRRAADLGGPALVAAWLTVAAAFVFAAHLLPGVVGGLSAASVAATSVMLAALTLAVPERLERPLVRRPPPAPSEPDWVRWVGFGALGAVAAYVLGWTLAHADEALAQPDVVSFHLPNVVAWIQEGSLWGIHDWIPNRAPGNYPQTGDLFMLATVLPWDSDFLARFAGYPFLGLAGLATYAAGRELAAPPGLAALTTAAVLAMPAVAYIALLGLADPQMIGTFAAGAFFLLRHWRTQDGFDLLLAGLGLGLAFGTRWYAVPAVAAVAGVWAVAALRRRRPRFWRDAGAITGLIALTGGFWLLRNWVESGNPVFPVKLAPFGITIFDAPPDTYRELNGETLSHYLTDYTAFRVNIWPTFLDFLSFTAVALWAGIASAALLALRRGEELAGRILALAAIAAAIGLVYVATPYTGAGEDAREAYTNSRYVVPALLCAAPALAWLLARSATLTAVGAGLLGLAVLDALRRATELPLGDLSAGALLAGIALVAAGRHGLSRARDSTRARSRAPRSSAEPRRSPQPLSSPPTRSRTATRTTATPPSAPTPPRPTPPPPAPASASSATASSTCRSSAPASSTTSPTSAAASRSSSVPTTEFQPFARALRSGAYDAIAWRDLDTLTPELPQQQARWLDRLGWRVAVGGHQLAPARHAGRVSTCRPTRGVVVRRGGSRQVQRSIPQRAKRARTLSRAYRARPGATKLKAGGR